MEKKLDQYFDQMRESLRADMPLADVSNIVSNAPATPPTSGGFGLNGTVLATAGAVVVGGVIGAFMYFQDAAPEPVAEANNLPIELLEEPADTQQAEPPGECLSAQEMGFAGPVQPTVQQASTQDAPLQDQAYTVPSSNADVPQPTEDGTEPTESNAFVEATTPTTPIKPGPKRKAKPTNLVFERGNVFEFSFSPSSTTGQFNAMKHYLGLYEIGIEVAPQFEDSTCIGFELTCYGDGTANLWNSRGSNNPSKYFDLEPYAEVVLQLRLNSARQVHSCEYSMELLKDQSNNTSEDVEDEQNNFELAKSGTTINEHAHGPAPLQDEDILHQHRIIEYHVVVVDTGNTDKVTFTIRNTSSEQEIEAVKEQLKALGLRATFHSKYEGGIIDEFTAIVKMKGNQASMAADNFKAIAIVVDLDEKGKATNFDFEFNCDQPDEDFHGMRSEQDALSACEYELAMVQAELEQLQKRVETEAIIEAEELQRAAEEMQREMDRAMRELEREQRLMEAETERIAADEARDRARAAREMAREFERMELEIQRETERMREELEREQERIERKQEAVEREQERIEREREQRERLERLRNNN